MAISRNCCEKVGVEYAEIKSAPLKGEPSLFHDPPPGAEAMLKRVIDDTYDWFVGLVAERRKLPIATARSLADGSIYSGRQALRLKLIDEVGGDEEARAWLAEREEYFGRSAAPRMEAGRLVLRLVVGATLLAGLARLSASMPTRPRFFPRRLAVDGLLSLWQATFFGRSDR